ncbi:hypothetical protein CASFOL_001156 [Castilleja foliolosa]|uniref:Uncharacterized protein n=1 Tax=Castilleja foliolosa TaxID=1961234 RepID=A0ABD3EMA6_9LAMI
MQAGQEISLSPSFNSFSDGKLAGIAARVVDELDSDEFHGDFNFERRGNSVDQGEPGGASNNHNPEYSDVDDDDFDFAFVIRDSDPSSQIPADEIFQNGKIRPVNQLFGKNENAKEINGDRDSNSDRRPRVRHPLSSLFIEETETTRMTTSPSSSSSEADEMDREAGVEGWWKKSASAGDSSKRWKLKSLLPWSHSYGSKDSYDVAFARTNSAARKKEQDEKKVKQMPLDGGVMKPAPPNRDGGEKLRSYLPYRVDLVGVFGNVNGQRKA